VDGMEISGLQRDVPLGHGEGGVSEQSMVCVYHPCTKPGGFHKFSTDWGGT